MKYVLSLFFLLLLIRCKTPAYKHVDVKKDSTTNGKVIAATVDSLNNTPSPALYFKPFYYTGLVTCTGCPEVHEQLLLLPTHYFHWLKRFENIDTPNQVQEGIWRWQQNSLQLLVNDSVVSSYTVVDSGQSLIHTAGQVQYSLNRQFLGTGNAAWLKKKKAGIDFFALGTEPFWSLEIDAEKGISFLLAGAAVPVKFTWGDPEVQGNSLHYHVTRGVFFMDITIRPQFCSDGMSDNWYAYEVKVNYNGKRYNGCGVSLQEEGMEDLK